MKTEYRYSSSALFEVIDGRAMQTAANRLRIIRAIVRLIGKKKFGRVPFHFSPTYGNNFPARKTFSINSDASDGTQLHRSRASAFHPTD